MLSSSVMETVASVVPLAVTPMGRVFPKVSFTLSSSSSTSSSVAVKEIVSSVSPGTKVKLSGTPE